MKILITGGTGMIGSAFKNIKTNHELILVGSKDYDLRCPHHTEAIIEKIKPSAIIHLAARVGGVKGNSDYVADFFSENILINTNLLRGISSTFCVICKSSKLQDGQALIVALSSLLLSVIIVNENVYLLFPQ